MTRWGVVKEEVILMDPMVPRDTNELREKILFVLDVTIRILIIICLIVMIAMIIKGKIMFIFSFICKKGKKRNERKV